MKIYSFPRGILGHFSLSVAASKQPAKFIAVNCHVDTRILGIRMEGKQDRGAGNKNTGIAGN